jgi:membrane protease YdiL (CAAX protease family)
LPVTILYKYPDSPITGSLINFTQMFVISIVITFVRYKSHSVLAPALMHGMFNTMILTSNMDDYRIVLMKVILCILVIVIFFIFDFYRKRKASIHEKSMV